MKIRFLLLVLWGIVGVNQLYAQAPKRRNTIERHLKEIELEYEDSLNRIISKYAADTFEYRVRPNPRYYRLICAPTLYSSSIRNLFNAGEKKILYSIKEEYYLDLSPKSRTFWNQKVNHEVDRALFMAYSDYPEYFDYTEDQVMLIKSDAELDLKPTGNIIAHIIPEKQELEGSVTGTEFVIKKPNFWTTAGSVSLQFTQNYISGNWHKGGESTRTLVSGVTLEANYNDKQRIQFDNKLEVKLGFTTAPSDTLHEYRTNTDVLRFASKLGLKAISSWYYTIGLDVNTQMFPNYKTNTDITQSAFLAPLKANFNIGMDYKKSKKKYNVSVNLSPLAYQLTYVGDKDVDETNFGLKSGDKTLHDFGSSMKITSKWSVLSNVTWESRLDAFTNYEKVEASWENTIDFALTKLLTTKLFLHGRFDDGVKRKSGYSYFQFKEFLSIGFDYKW